MQGLASGPASGPCPHHLPAVVLDGDIARPCCGFSLVPWRRTLAAGTCRGIVVGRAVGGVPLGRRLASRGTHPVAVEAPSTQHWGQEQQQTGDSNGGEFEGLGQVGGGVLPRSEGPPSLGRCLREKSGRHRG